MHEFDAGDGDRGGSKLLQAEHWTQAKLDRPVVLFNEVIEVFRRSNLSPRAASMLFEKFTRRSMRSLIAVELILRGNRPRLANARRKNALAAATSRLARNRKSTVFPALSTAR